MNQEGLEKLLQDKFTLGADLSIAAGPVGRTASAATDAQMAAFLKDKTLPKVEGLAIRPNGTYVVRGFLDALADSRIFDVGRFAALLTPTPSPTP